MKHFLISILALVITGCTNKTVQEHAILQTTVTTLVDVTDATTLKLWPDAKQLLNMYECAEFPDRACKFSITSISDLKTNRVYQAYLPDATETEKNNIYDDMQWRSKLIQKYYRDVQNTLQRFYTENDTSINRTHSEVWESIARNLEALAKEPAGTKYLMIYSDLQELSLAGNAYKSFHSMSVEAIIKKLTDATPIPEGISGIQVIIVYQPTDREADLRFSKTVAVYKQMLEAKGAVVSEQIAAENQ